MLSFLLIIPVITSIYILIFCDSSFVKQNSNQSKLVAILGMVINFIFSIFIWIQFDSSTSNYQFVETFNQLNFINISIGIDGISLYFVLLTTFISPIALLSNIHNIEAEKNIKFFLISFLLLESLQILAFIALDLLLFYVFFESILPILFIIIILYGSGKNRIRSAYLFFLFTLAGSLPMLLAILDIFLNIGSTDFQIISLQNISLNNQILLFLGFIIAFSVKTPLWPLTGWLYRAHADSPLAGSIILAGTVLKLSNYAMVRVLLTFLPDAANFFSPIVLTIATISLIFASLSTIVQQDTKTLIAYSSICHQAVAILGIFSNTIQGIEGSILLAIAHGLISPALFICVGGIIYERTGTRIINEMRGLVVYMPIFTILFLISIFANTAVPLTLNFLGEQLSLIGIWFRNPIIAFLGATGILFSACYSIFIFNRLAFGSYSPQLKPILDINKREYYLLMLLIIPTFILGIFPNVILDTLHFSVTNILYEVTSI